MPIRTLTAITAARLDKVLAALLGDVSRSAAQRLIEQEQVTVNGQTRQASYAVRPGDVLVVNVPEPQPAVVLAEPIALDIIFENEDVLAVNKPAGMVVHPGAGNLSGTLANALLARAPDIAGVGDPLRPGIVHRLDKETSGIVLLAKNAAAYSNLQMQFKRRVVKKLYLALCVGDVQPPRGVIDKPIARDPAHRQRMAIVIGGRQSVTRYTVGEVYKVKESRFITEPGIGRGDEAIELKPGSVYSFVRAWPATGRTHQLRVHFASIGFPIVGDALYGASRRDTLSRGLAPRHLLHASELSFELPASGEEVNLHAPLPDDMRRVMDVLGE